MSLSMNGFYREFDKLPSYQQTILKECLGDRLPKDPEKQYIAPTLMIRRVVAFLSSNGHTELLRECGRCGGTGLYDSYTSYKDIKGRPFCFHCGGSGYSLKKLSAKRMEELKILLK